MDEEEWSALEEEDGGAPPKQAGSESDVHRLEVDGREILLVGTAHVSQQSVDLVREVVERERPDAVCIELDEGRYEALSQEKRFEEQDLREVLRKKQLATLLPAQEAARHAAAEPDPRLLSAPTRIAARGRPGQ
jgi:hypothetical protein